MNQIALFVTLETLGIINYFIKMSSKLNWKSENEFSINGVNFTIDQSLGYKNRKMTEENNFTIVKDKTFLKIYEDIASRYKDVDNIIELGVFQGGGLVYLDCIFNPKVLHGIEISEKRIEPLDNYCQNSNSNLKIHYGKSQDDQQYLEALVATEFNNTLDAVVDDARHTYDLTRRSFEILFPLLKPGGIYIIEDWSWGYEKTYEAPHVWATETSLIKLTLELINNVGSDNTAIESVEVLNPLIIIKKSHDLSELPDLDMKVRNRETPFL